jgi:ABC-type uncharacterized transport system involved in gliding motility auxiliary subunit
MAEEPQATKADKPEAAPAKKPAAIKRVQIGLNVIIQIVLVIFLVGLANYFSFHHFKRFDHTRDQKYVLSGQTKQVLAGLNKPVKAVVFFATGSEIFTDVVTLLREYEYASKTKFQTEVVDPYRNFSRARALQDKYKFGANENVVILDYEGKSKFVNAADMAEMDQSGIMMGQAPTLKAFKGEQAMTSALLELTEEKQSKFYVVAGHGGPELSAASINEPNPGPESMKALATYIERQNIKIETLKLADVEKVPDDARALLIIAPKYDFSERETKLLREYWARKGRLFVSLDTMHPLERLTDFFVENGIRPQDDRVLRLVTLSGATGILREVSAVIKEGHPITKRMAGVDTQFMGQTQSIYLDVQRAKPQGINVTSLIEAGSGYHGETDNAGGEGAPVYFDTKKDHAPPLSLAVSVEMGALSDNRVSVDTSRMVVVGNGDFLRDSALTETGLDFTIACFNWLLNREDLIAVPPKQRNSFTLNLSDEQMAQILLAVVFGVPGLVAICGLAAWWQRRN